MRKTPQLGNWLQSCRKRAGLTQLDVAVLCGLYGLHKWAKEEDCHEIATGTLDIIEQIRSHEIDRKGMRLIHRQLRAFSRGEEIPEK